VNEGIHEESGSTTRTAARLAVAALLTASVFSTTPAALAQSTDKPFEPVVGQEGKDVIWVPTPIALTEKMLDMAKVTPNDFVIDLGSGDGRNVIAAAKRGARGLGVEYNLNMVELSRRNAEKEGVAEKAQFVQGDMYEADISQASVMALFLLPENLRRLTPKFLALKPGSRIVANGFGIDGWEADETGKSTGDCGSWCTAFLYIVPAQVGGAWRLPKGELTLEQKFQTLSGTLRNGSTVTKISNARLRGDQISFTAGNTKYTGRVAGDVMEGRTAGMSSGAWKATRATHTPH
jgi:hypothetical protein